MVQPDLLLPPQDELPSLSTARLFLRPMRMADAPDVFAYAREPEVLRFTTATPPRDAGDTYTFLRDVLAAPYDRMWAIQLHEKPTVVGAIEFGLQSPVAGSIHYALAQPLWGRGLMTEAVDAVCRWAFTTLDALAEIRTNVAHANVGSARVLEKCGFKRAGATREDWGKSRGVCR